MIQLKTSQAEEANLFIGCWDDVESTDHVGVVMPLRF